MEESKGMLDLKTVNDVMLLATGRGEQRAALAQDASGGWQPITSAQLRHRVRALAAVLQQWGVQKGDRVAILSENRWEWPITDFATLAIGAVDVPLYSTLTKEQIASMLRDSGAKVAVVSTAKQYAKVAAVREQTHLEQIVVMDCDPAADPANQAVQEMRCNAASFSDLVGDLGAQAIAALADGSEEAFVAMAREVQPDDLATIIYTSGTTGESKGVMLTHGNIASNLNYSTAPFGWTEKDSCISFLPLSHITARALDYAAYSYGATLAYCPHFDQLSSAMLRVKPTIFVGVPRVYEKIREAVQLKSAPSKLKSSILKWALAVGRRNREATLRGEKARSFSSGLADKLVYSKIRAAFGGRVVDCVSGGAPLGIDTAGWFADVGIRIFEGYGLTETSPVVALNNRLAYRIGSVGKPLPNMQCRIAADGELEVKGPAVFKGYWNKPQETAEVFTADGWFLTGDIARIDEDGFLYITDRKKELLKTSGGKFIAPQPIENSLKSSLLVGFAAVVGDKHKFASVLISPNFPALEDWARGQGIDFSSRQNLVQHPRVVAEYQAIVDRVNSGLANFESLKRMHLVAEEWSIETGELTPSMKLMRRIIAKKYAGEIAAFYADEAVSHR